MLDNIQHTALLFLLLSFIVGVSAPYKKWRPATQADWNGLFNISVLVILVTTLIRIWAS